VAPVAPVAPVPPAAPVLPVPVWAMATLLPTQVTIAARRRMCRLFFMSISDLLMRPRWADKVAQA
jgi:hypothetical protein